MNSLQSQPQQTTQTMPAAPETMGSTFVMESLANLVVTLPVKQLIGTDKLNEQGETIREEIGYSVTIRFRNTQESRTFIESIQSGSTNEVDELRQVLQGVHPLPGYKFPFVDANGQSLENEPGLVEMVLNSPVLRTGINSTITVEMQNDVLVKNGKT